MSNSLADGARAIGLPVCSRTIGSYQAGVPAPAPLDRALAEAPARDVPTLVGQLTRRGLASGLVAALREAWQERPLERALLAWDVLNGSLIADAGLVGELRDEARLVGAVLPEPGRAAILQRPQEIDQLVRAIAVPALDRAGDTSARGLPLGALRSVARDETLLELHRQYARALHRAHLPALASFRLADLSLHHGYAPALVDLVELLLDEEVADAERWLGDADGSPALVELATYARLRSLNNREEWGEALAFADKHREALASLRLPPAEAARINPRPTLAYAEAALRNGRATVSYEHVAAITSIDTPWRYAFRVLLTYAATRIKDAQFVDLVAMHLGKLGNDVHVWYDPMAVAPDDARWGRGLVALLAREAQALPHDPSVWKAAALLLGDESAGDAVDEVDRRLASQATLG